jgi:hypothetical protein
MELQLSLLLTGGDDEYIKILDGWRLIVQYQVKLVRFY